MHRQPPIWIRNLSVALMFVALAMSATEIIVSVSQAATVHVLSEAENGTQAGLASLQSGAAATGASGSSAVKFGGGSTSQCIAPPGAQLQDQAPNATQLPPWKHVLGEKAVIYFENKDLTPEYAAYLTDGEKSWEQSPCIDIRIVASCPVDVNCVKGIMSADAPGTTRAEFSGGVNQAETIMLEGDITFYTGNLNQESVAQRRMTTVHEMGHAVSMSHRASTKAIMYSSSNAANSLNPDAVDLNNLLVKYGTAGEATQNTATGMPQNTGGALERVKVID